MYIIIKKYNKKSTHKKSTHKNSKHKNSKQKKIKYTKKICQNAGSGALLKVFNPQTFKTIFSKIKLNNHLTSLKKINKKEFIDKFKTEFKTEFKNNINSFIKGHVSQYINNTIKHNNPQAKIKNNISNTKNYISEITNKINNIIKINLSKFIKDNIQKYDIMTPPIIKNSIQFKNPSNHKISILNTKLKKTLVKPYYHPEELKKLVVTYKNSSNNANKPIFTTEELITLLNPNPNPNPNTDKENIFFTEKEIEELTQEELPKEELPLNELSNILSHDLNIQSNNIQSNININNNVN